MALVGVMQDDRNGATGVVVLRCKNSVRQRADAASRVVFVPVIREGKWHWVVFAFLDVNSKRVKG
eukprot:m.64008 g.64008  ORF g.64008 m.64008 type:complete len:65 (-) comp11985_c0_seq1:902-1096(-)